MLTIVDTPGSRYLKHIVYGIYLSDSSFSPSRPLSVQDGTATVMRTCSALDVPIIAIFVTKMDDTHDHPYSEEDYLKVSDDVMARWRRKCPSWIAPSFRSRHCVGGFEAADI